MAQPEEDRAITRSRAAMSVLGGLAGLALWLLAEVLPDVQPNPRVYIALIAFTAAFFGMALALSGPASLQRALGAALGVAVPSTALLSLAGLRFADASDIANGPSTLMVFVGMVMVSTPFTAVWLQNRTAWRNYPDLFDTSWTIVVRYAAAWLFVGVFWAVLMLSNALLGLVGIDIIEDLIDVEAVPYVLSGMVLGVALAVVHELRAYVSPYLVLRLLRLLLPFVLIVVVIFIAALPFRGLSNLFGEFSAGGTLMGMAIGSIVLITIALDKDNSGAVRTPGMRYAAQALALVLPILAGLSVYAVVVRVVQYGWTPDRVFAAVSAMFLLIYAIGYAVVAFMRHHWMARVRQINVVLALCVIAVGAIWMTPVLNAEKISARSQVNRFEAGKANAGQLPLWEMAHEWGYAGQAGLERLEKIDADGALTPMIAVARAAETKYSLNTLQNAVLGDEQAKILARILPVRPKDVVFDVDDLADLHPALLERWTAACELTLDDGEPACVLIIARFDRSEDRQAVFLSEGQGSVNAEWVPLGDGKDQWARNMYDLGQKRWSDLPGGTVARVQAGDFSIGPSSMKALFIGSMELIPDN